MLRRCLSVLAGVLVLFSLPYRCSRKAALRNQRHDFRSRQGGPAGGGDGHQRATGLNRV